MWLDLRELAEDPMKLLSIFHVRTAYTASSWTMFDTSESINAWAKDYYGTWYNERCVTMCGKNYGTLCSFDAERAHKWAVVGFPRALTTVQAQHELLYTLQKIMKTIIGENSATGAAHFEVVVSSGLRTSGGDAAWSSYTHQAFTAPKAFDTRTVSKPQHEGRRAGQCTYDFTMRRQQWYTHRDPQPSFDHSVCCCIFERLRLTGYPTPRRSRKPKHGST